MTVDRRLWNEFKLDYFDPYPSQKNDILDILEENEKEYVLEIELPRYKKEEIKITIEEDGYLYINAQKEMTGYFKKLSICEFSIDRTKISARLEDGVLYITLPKKTPQTQEIKIE